ncbi:hypothetical protein FQV39_28560 [Bosea sp. F3-2]|uniref:helix-turn-helix transcriptional regulator n=1 Tax=Bosea sp. F3-2 TaxID=2599640 RepID=UPI0011EFFE58|nr:hypothetical protein [Bosea sp. F3-2]QEL26120.1 hypothetical protein FQV39_28560 [Bosea sp. F3-2]
MAGSVNMAAAPPITPRLLTRAQAAGYCAMTPSRFSQLVKAGTLPAAVPGTTRWDRMAIDAALDKFAGLASPEKAGSALDRWLSKNGSRAA